VTVPVEGSSERGTRGTDGLESFVFISDRRQVPRGRFGARRYLVTPHFEVAHQHVVRVERIIGVVADLVELVPVVYVDGLAIGVRGPDGDGTRHGKQDDGHRDQRPGRDVSKPSRARESAQARRALTEPYAESWEVAHVHRLLSSNCVSKRHSPVAVPGAGHEGRSRGGATGIPRRRGLPPEPRWSRRPPAVLAVAPASTRSPPNGRAGPELRRPCRVAPPLWLRPTARRTNPVPGSVWPSPATETSVGTGSSAARRPRSPVPRDFLPVILRRSQSAQLPDNKSTIIKVLLTVQCPKTGTPPSYHTR